MAEYCDSSVIVPKLNGMVCLCLDSTKLIQMFLGPLHTGQTLNDILPKLSNTHYTTTMGAGLGYHDLKLNKNFIPYHICISILWVQIHQTTYWKGGSGWHFLVKDQWDIWEPTKCVWYCRWHFSYMMSMPGTMVKSCRSNQICMPARKV